MNRVLLIILSSLFFFSCHVSHNEEALYKVNDNFIVQYDSLSLQRDEPLHNQPVDTFSGFANLYKGDRFVVAQIMVIPEDSVDSVWVKLAKDQTAMGWMRQNDFLSAAIPDDSISQFISVLSDIPLWYPAVIIMAVTLLIIARQKGKLHFHLLFVHDIPSFYPSMLVVAIGALSLYYADIHKFSPETWMQYYYHPTLNPFTPETVTGIFVTIIWLTVVLFIATIDEVFSQLQLADTLLYLFTLVGICLASCLLFSNASLYLVNHVLLLALFVFSVWRYRKKSFPHYQCGRCGAKMSKKGRCEHCGAINE